MSHCPIVPWDPIGHPTSPRSGIHTWSLLSIPSHSSMVPWDPMEHTTSLWARARARVRARSGTAGISHGIPRHHGTIGWDGQEELSTF